jgi:hypothetical protein
MFLRLLVEDVERAGRAGGDPGATASWTNVTVFSFMWAWVSAVRAALDGGDMPGRDTEGGGPGWVGLAYQLRRARTAMPRYNCVLADSGAEWHDVTDVNGLRMYLAALAMDFHREQQELAEKSRRGEWTGDGGRWAHSSLGAWLDAWAAWLEGAYLAAIPVRDRSEIEPVTWRSVAIQLAAARVYE